MSATHIVPRRALRLLTALVALAVSGSALAIYHGCDDCAPSSPPSGGSVNPSWITWVPAPPSQMPVGTEYLVQTFVGDNDVGQCNGGFHGTQAIARGYWSLPIRFDTDSRPGGCRLRYFMYSEQQMPYSSGLAVAFAGEPGQCGNAGSYAIPALTTLDAAQIDALPWHRIDTDNRSGGCQLTFGTTDFSAPRVNTLEVKFTGDGAYPQCRNQGDHLAFPRNWPNFALHSVTLEIDTDDAPGGCWLELRFGDASSFGY